MDHMVQVHVFVDPLDTFRCEKQNKTFGRSPKRKDWKRAPRVLERVWKREPWGNHRKGKEAYTHPKERELERLTKKKTQKGQKEKKTKP